MHSACRAGILHWFVPFAAAGSTAEMTAAPSDRFLGITVLGDFLLSEGPDAVLENLLGVGATAVACNPTVTAEADEATGSFQPPRDGGSSPRVFDRPLFGKHALWVRSGVSYHPNPKCYTDSPYEHRQPNDLTDAHGHVIGEFLDKATAAGLKTYFQVGAVQPSGMRDEDRPRLPDGSLPVRRMADTGSLASEAIRAYNRAYVRDLLEAYPQVTGFRPDWPEYPCYTFDEIFRDFGTHAETWARAHGFDFDRMRADVGEFFSALQGRLRNEHLQEFASPDRGRFAMLSWFHERPGIAEWLRFKSALSADVIAHWREIITQAGGTGKELMINAFMPPYSILTGLNFAAAARHAVAVSPKLYTMHWSQMVSFWGDVLLETNPGLDESLVVRTLVNLMDIVESDDSRDQLADFGYPNPDEPHPIANEPQLRKLGQARIALRGNSQLYPLVHGYGPCDDYARRLQVVAHADVPGLWINRYGYLGDEKLQATARIWK